MFTALSGTSVCGSAVFERVRAKQEEDEERSADKPNRAYLAYRRLFRLQGLPRSFSRTVGSMYV